MLCQTRRVFAELDLTMLAGTRAQQTSCQMVSGQGSTSTRLEDWPEPKVHLAAPNSKFSSADMQHEKRISALGKDMESIDAVDELHNGIIDLKPTSSNQEDGEHQDFDHVNWEPPPLCQESAVCSARIAAKLIQRPACNYKVLL